MKIEDNLPRVNYNVIDALSQIQKVMLLSEDIHEIIRRIAEYACYVANADWASIIYIDLERLNSFITPSADRDFSSQSEFMNWVEYENVGPRLPEEIVDIIRPFGMSIKAMHEQHAVIIPNVESMSDEVNPRLLKMNVKSALCLPLMESEGKSFGVLWFHYRKLEEFTPEKIKELNLFALSASTAYRNQLDKERSRREFEILQNTTEHLNTDQSIEEILRQATIQARRLMNVDGKTQSIFLSHLAIFEEGYRVRFYAEHNDPSIYKMLTDALGPDASMHTNKGYPRSITGRTAIERKPNLIEDVMNDPDYIHLGGAGGSQISVPIFMEGRVYAILNVEHIQKHIFDERHFQVLKALAKQISDVITSKQRQKTFEALVVAGQEITKGASIEDVLNAIAKQAYYLTEDKSRQPDKKPFVHVGQKIGNDLHYIAAYPIETLTRFAEQDYGTIDLSQYGKRAIGISGRAAKLGQTENVIDVRDDTDYLNVSLDAAKQDHEVYTILSQLAVPMKSNDKVVGVISIDHPFLDAFSAHDKDAIELLAGLAAVAYDNIMQSEKKNRTFSTLKAVPEITERLFRDDASFDDILRVLTEQALLFVQAGGADKRSAISHLAIVEGGVLRFSPLHNDIDYMQKIVGTPLGIGIDLAQESPQRIGISGRAFLDNSTRVEPEVSQLKDKKKQFVPDYIEVPDWEGGSQLSIPIRLHSMPIGVLSVEHREKYHFDQQDKETLEVLVRQTESLIENRERAKVLEQLSEAVHDISRQLDIEAILRSLAAHAYEILSWRFGKQAYFVHVTRNEDDMLRYVSSYPKSMERPQDDMEFSVDDINKAYKNNWRFTDPMTLPTFETKSRLSIPIRFSESEMDLSVNSVENSRDTIGIGLITVEHSLPKAFGEFEKANLVSLATMAAIAINKAQLLQQTVSLTEIGRVSSQQHLELVRNVSHDLRTPLHNVDLFLQNLQRKEFSSINDELFIRNLESSRRQLMALGGNIDQLLSEKNTPNLIQINLLELVTRVIEAIHLNAIEANIEIAPIRYSVSTPDLYIDPDMMRTVFQNLLENAIKFTETEDKRLGKISVSVDVVDVDREVEVRITDTGIGIPQSDLLRIFDRNVQLDPSRGGAGLGLSKVKHLLQLHGGRIWAQNNDEGGASFIFRLKLSEI